MIALAPETEIYAFNNLSFHDAEFVRQFQVKRPHVLCTSDICGIYAYGQVASQAFLTRSYFILCPLIRLTGQVHGYFYVKS